MAPPGESARQDPAGRGAPQGEAESAGTHSNVPAGAGPGFYPGPSGELGTWVLHVRGGGALAVNVVSLLGSLAGSKPPDAPSRVVMMRLIDAFVEASPDYGE